MLISATSASSERRFLGLRLPQPGATATDLLCALREAITLEAAIPPDSIAQFSSLVYSGLSERPSNASKSDSVGYRCWELRFVTTQYTWREKIGLCGCCRAFLLLQDCRRRALR